MNNELSPEQLAAVEKIQKLLNLAAKNPNEAEAASAASKAQELLARYNLDAATVENKSGVDGRREEAKVAGGFYSYQRDLWNAVAQLNFCMWWRQEYRAQDWRYVDDWSGAKSMKGGPGKTRKKVDVLKWRHVLVGRIVNTRTTIVMAEYLQNAIERILLERLAGRDDHVLSNWAASYRKGATSRIVEKLRDRRETILAEERERQRQAERAATGASTATALTLSNYVDSETDANMDFVYGEGWSAKQAAARAERAAERARREAEYTAWAKANPEEAKAAADEAEKRSKKSRWRGGRTERDNTDYSAYYAGYDAAEKISLNQQVDDAASVRKIGRR